MVHSPRSATARSLAETPRDGLYVVLISVHGLIRGEEPELGRDADTGGQVTYVLDLAREVGRRPEVARVDLLTRRIESSRVADDYARPGEELGPGAHLIRLPCGPRRYLHKERLWPYLGEFVDEALGHFRRLGRIPDVVHGHYADAGWLATRLSALLGVPQVHTGHSLGRVKKARLLDAGMDEETLEERFNIRRRIRAEETALQAADLVISSTRQEVEEQWGLYDHVQPDRMVVIPPGVDLSRFQPPVPGEPEPPYTEELARFLRRPDQPMILAIARPDRRKNLTALVEAYGGNAALREAANLVILAGNRDDVADKEAMPNEQRAVLRDLLVAVDRHDLYGRAAYPKHHDSEDVPDLYRLAARRRGVFVNPALTEPFGLTLIEAAASGLPLVATDDGGPREILSHCRNGVLIDPLDTEALGKTLLDALADPERWERWSEQGVDGAKDFSWQAHAERYLQELEPLLASEHPIPRIGTADPRARSAWSLRTPPHPSHLLAADRLAIFDIDNTLVGDADALDELMARLEALGPRVVFGVATGRRPDSAVEVLEEWGAPPPGLVVACVGSEIYYGSGEDLVADEEWALHIQHRWRPAAIREALDDVPGLTLQEESEQRRFKVSYYVDDEIGPSRRQVLERLKEAGAPARVIHSHGEFLDLLPLRASKGRAVVYLSKKWDIPLSRVLVAGDSGNDLEMLTTDTLAVVVGNHAEELADLRGKAGIYFAEATHAAGILEGAEHWEFFREPDGS